ncbi:Wzy polymerase domain-containing protein [Neisseria gonorrhoeae]
MSAETTVSGARPAAKLPIYILPCFLWIGIIPFTFALRLKPSPDFYHDAAAAAGLIVLLFLTAGKKLFDVKIPAISFLLFAMAAFWWLQARLMNLIYPGMNDIASWVFILLAVSAWACKSLVAHYGQERIVTLFAWSLLIGSLLQSCIVVIQFAGWENTPLLQNIIVHRGQGVIGHIGQRNNLGHYLMWGILASAYLNGQRKIPAALGAICLIMQTAVLGLVNSRTILTYIAAIALILPFWYFRSDKSNRRTMLGIAAAVFLTALFQFSMNAILETFTGIRYETAVERVANGGFTDLPRQSEWNKALAAFQSAPIFGHGWNSFAQQTFLINAEQHTIHDNFLSTLFTHSHNIILQLLAEMGISGTLLVAATLLTGIAGLLKRSLTPASLFLLCALAVSMCHSMLEYPLWYVYFLIPFGLMLFLSPAEASDGIAFKKAANLGILTASAAIFAGLLHLDWTHTRLVNSFSPAADDSAKTLNRKINELRYISANSPMLSFYADFSLVNFALPEYPETQTWAEEATLKALKYRPYSATYRIALYLMRQGKVAEAKQWMRATQSYYPYLMPRYADEIRKLPVWAPLLPELLKDCKAFAAAPGHPETKPCKRPASADADTARNVKLHARHCKKQQTGREIRYQKTLQPC